MPSYRTQGYGAGLSQDTPGVNVLIAANAASFILDFLNLLPGKLYDILVSNSVTVWRSPWTFFTYPLISRSLDAWKFISLLFGLWWLYVVGGILERAYGTRRFLTFFFVFSAISAFFISLGGMAFGTQIGFGELICPLVDLTVIWAMMEPEAPVMLLMIPMRVKWLALITSLMLLFQFGNPLGFFALGGPVLAYLYTRRQRSGPYFPQPKPPSKGSSIMNPFEWYRRWKFKRRFRRLWGD